MVSRNDFFSAQLAHADPDVFATVSSEWQRQTDGIELIASENLVSLPVMQAMASIFTNKYAEGYPHRRYYGGCFAADQLEEIAIERAKKIFGCQFVNVQPHSGSQANQAVFMAVMQPHDCFLGMALDEGGHLTHGAKANLSGKWFRAASYGLNAETEHLDYDHLEEQALHYRPKIIIAGGSAYSRILDFARFREIADKVGAVLMADIAHIAGLVAAKIHPSPFPHAHVVTTTTHKTLRCGRGGMIMTNDPALAKKIDSAVFPGLQGGPLLPMIASKAVGLGEVLKPAFVDYCQQVVNNAQTLAQTLTELGLKIVSGGTDNHLMLVDLRPYCTGKSADTALELCHITCNKNAVPKDPEKPTVTSGIRLGTPAATSRGFGTDEFRTVGQLIASVITALRDEKFSDSFQNDTRNQVIDLCRRFPIYSQSAV